MENSKMRVSAESRHARFAEVSACAFSGQNLSGKTRFSPYASVVY
jgi:hypothetical protein